MSNTSMPANFLNRTPLPSITGLAASGPMSPRPSTAVPLVMTRHQVARRGVAEGVGRIADLLAGRGPPGEYASARSCWLTSCLVAAIAILPGWDARGTRGPPGAVRRACPPSPAGVDSTWVLVSWAPGQAGASCSGAGLAIVDPVAGKTLVWNHAYRHALRVPGTNAALQSGRGEPTWPP